MAVFGDARQGATQSAEHSQDQAAAIHSAATSECRGQGQSTGTGVPWFHSSCAKCTKCTKCTKCAKCAKCTKCTKCTMDEDE